MTPAVTELVLGPPPTKGVTVGGRPGTGRGHACSQEHLLRGCLSLGPDPGREHTPRLRSSGVYFLLGYRPAGWSLDEPRGLHVPTRSARPCYGSVLCASRHMPVLFPGAPCPGRGVRQAQCPGPALRVETRPGEKKRKHEQLLSGATGSSHSRTTAEGEGIKLRHHQFPISLFGKQGQSWSPSCDN